MSTTLNQKLASIQNDQIVAQLSLLLSGDQKVFISWWGQKMVSFTGYKEAVPINTLAEKYLQVASLQHIPSVTLEERLNCYYLWRQISLLYERSDKALEKTWTYKYLIPTLECRLYWGWQDVEARIRGRIFPTKMDNLLAFTAETCLKLWPDHPEAKDWKMEIAEKQGGKITVTPVMVAQVIGREGKKTFS